MTKSYLNKKISLLKPSATLGINELSLELIKEGVEIFRLGFGQSPFPVPKQIVKALQDNAHQKDYLPVKGLYRLREVIAKSFKDNYKLCVTAEDILIGPGSKELIFDYMVAVSIDELLLPLPSWVSYEPQAKLNNHKVIWLSTNEKNDWKITPDMIIKHCGKEPTKKRTIILNYPSNPLGISYSYEELKAIAEVLKKYEITVVADEIYGEIHHDGNHVTIAEFYPEGTIISSGLSKWAGAGGWRLGFFVFPKKLKFILEAMAAVASETFTSTSAPIQYAAVDAFIENKAITLYLDNSRKILKAVGLYVFNELIKIGVTMPKPAGGFYLFPNFSKWQDALNHKGIENSKSFCNVVLKKTGVALLPGEVFGMPNEIYTARLSYVDFNGTELLNFLEDNPSVSVDDKFVELHCPKIVLAIKRLKDWLLHI